MTDHKMQVQDAIRLMDQALSGASGPVDNEALVRLAELAVRLYAKSFRESDGHNLLKPLYTRLEPTDVAIFVDHLLEAAHLELFEVQMWRSLGANVP